ncbi:MAG: elongation factor P maturation arginine rhamnosyltransferase EarP [bacterium]
MQWDLFCRVIDNFGDIGVCWRLAADLAGRGEAVRLWTDDAGALAWMAPQGAPGVQVCAWPADGAAVAEPGEVVIEAFGCALPPPFVAAMAARAAMARPPVWINLEYLSAEDYVERNHGLPSPQASGPGRGLAKWFFYPGFTERSGGLLREPGLAQRQRDFAAQGRRAWLTAQGLAPAAGERCVSLFCYHNAALAALLDDLAQAPTLLLATPGPAARQLRALLGPQARRGALRARELPALTQRDFDLLLWSCDLNLVRGEDSFVRAQWAGQPFLWQAYPQEDGAHAGKLAAFQQRFLAGAAPALAAAGTRAGLAWNGLLPAPAQGLLPAPPLWPAWRAPCAVWRDRLLAQPDLAGRLRAFVAERR